MVLRIVDLTSNVGDPGQGPGDVCADFREAAGLEPACGVVHPALDAGASVDHAQDGHAGVRDPRHPGQGPGGTPRVE